jgi:diguanylate cyclase (GGDEF)-like protein/PAS domain S-box-containing protein
MPTILLLDDRPANCHVLRSLFGFFTSHRLLEAHGAVQALELVRAERPDLIITDTSMPTMNGHEFVQRLRADPLLAGVRVIFYCASGAVPETMAMARSCGVQTVLARPSDPHTIFKAINAELALARLAGQSVPPLAFPAATIDAAVRNAAIGSTVGAEQSSAEQAIAAVLEQHAGQPGLAHELAALFASRVALENLNLHEAVQRQAARLQREASVRRKAAAALRESEQRLVLASRVFDSTAESIMVVDAMTRIVRVNPAFEQVSGYSEKEVLGRHPSLLRSGRHDEGFFDAIQASLAASGQWRGEIWNRRKNGEVYPERTSISTVRDAESNIRTYVVVSSDISALKAAHHQLDFLSNHDPLTLLPNRSVLSDRLQQAIAAAARHGERQIALLLFNIDRLQRINDSLGHETGDTMLKEMARRVGTLTGPTDTLAHLGGDEFVLLLTECAEADEIIVAAHRLIDSIAQPFQVGGHELIVTASVGISIYPRDGAAPGELLKAADVAMSHMKEAGRNGFRFFKGEMNAHALRSMALETHLRRAIERNELSLHYQPQVSLSGGRICSMEALLRWRSPELGLVPPSDFIALAEDTGLILPIGNWVIRQACVQNKAWQDAGLAPRKVAVNVSAHQFMAGTVPAVVRAALQGAGLEARWLEVELTESVMMHDSEATAAQLAELSAMGVSISLDDFGTGYSSLAYLSRFVLDKLKIDQAFVRGVTTEPRSAAIAQATVALAHSLSLLVVAEGVETDAQLNFLKGIGCNGVQGYLLSRPVPAAEMAVLLSGDPWLLTDRKETEPG